MTTLPAWHGPALSAASVEAGDRSPFASATRRLPGFRSAVFCAYDETGRPTMRRVRPSADAGSFTIDVGRVVRPGRASLPCHSHDDRLTALRAFVVSGDIKTDGTGGG